MNNFGTTMYTLEPVSTGIRGFPYMTSALKGGRGPGKADKVREFRKGGFVKIWTRGGRSKNPKILRTSYMEAP